MPLFQIAKGRLVSIAQANFDAEKKLHTLVESNLEAVFGCRLVASEYSTGAQHSGRIDTLALSEDNNPVIIEYKKVESSDLINQSLFYLAWLSDHRGDFEMAAQKEFGSKTIVDWSAIRVICIAPNYKRYDLHAVQMMGANIELWTYRLFKNNSIYLEKIVFQHSVEDTDSVVGSNTGLRLTPGKKAALTRATGSYTFDEHLVNCLQSVREIALAVNDFIQALDPTIQVAPKKFYVAYKTAKNIVCMKVKKKHIVLFLKLDPKAYKGPQGISRDVSNIGHDGTGDLELTLRTIKDFKNARPFIEDAYHEVGS